MGTSHKQVSGRQISLTSFLRKVRRPMRQLVSPFGSERLVQTAFPEQEGNLWKLCLLWLFASTQGKRFQATSSAVAYSQVREALRLNQLLH